MRSSIARILQFKSQRVFQSSGFLLEKIPKQGVKMHFCA